MTHHAALFKLLLICFCFVVTVVTIRLRKLRLGKEEVSMDEKSKKPKQPLDADAKELKRPLLETDENEKFVDIHLKYSCYYVYICCSNACKIAEKKHPNSIQKELAQR